MTELQKPLFFGAAFGTVAMLFGVTAWAALRVGDYNSAVFCTTVGIIMGLAGVSEARRFILSFYGEDGEADK